MSDRRSATDRIRVFGPGPGGPRGFATTPQKADDVVGVVRRLWQYLRPYKIGMIWVGVLVGVMTAATVITPYLIKIAIDDCVADADMARLARVAGILIVLQVIAAAATWIQTVIMVHVSQKSVRDLRKDLFDRLQALSLRFFDTRPHGDVMSRLTNDTETVSNTLGQSVTQLISSVLAIAGSAVGMLLLNWRLAIVALLVVPITWALTEYLAKITRQGFRDRQRNLGSLNGVIEESVSGQRVIKVCRREEQAIGEFDTANSGFRVTATKADIYVGLMGPVMGLLRNANFAMIAAAGGWMAVKGLATVGDVAAFMTYARQFSRPLHMIAMLYGTIQSAIAGAERVFAIIDEVPEIQDKPDAKPLTEVKGRVDFDDVSFGYAEDVPVLQDVSFVAAPGQTIALVGPTGAGKTTIINLLTRFYDVDEGCIRVDGTDIRDLKVDDLRQALGIVLQDTFLFADTVRENIRYGCLDATDEEVEQAARLANAHEFIHKLPHGYDTELSEAGSSLSQGQRQLLAIARAVLADPAILILDEATSSVDTRTEIHIQEAMLRLMEGRTSFVIAHRLSTIRKADCIMVIDDGRIVERGTHAELMDSEGVYAGLHASQFAHVAV